MQCPYGSVWRKWDFHVHTPYSILNNNFGFNPSELNENSLEEKFDEYVKKLFTLAVENDIAAIGITDYFMLEGYKLIKENYLSSPDKMLQCFPDDSLRHKVEKIFVFPNIELRLENFVGEKAHPVNYHVIFSNDVGIQDIEENFLHQLKFNYDGGNKMALTISNIEKLGRQIKENKKSGSELLLGLENVTVNYSDIQKILENNPAFKNKYLITVPVDEDLSKVPWNGRDYSTRRNIYRQCHCLLTSNENTRKWALAVGHEEEQIKEFGSIKPCIWGSDAHEYKRMFNPAGERYCWVKSEPTFEGLLQIIYEPADRVCIQRDHPIVKDMHQVIDSVKIVGDDFQESPIYFNDSLTCIIGGKSTGKSTLLNQIAIASDGDFVLKSEVDLSHSQFKNAKAIVTWKDGTTSQRKIVYIPQNFLNSTIDNPEEETAISGIILDVLLQESTIKEAHDNLKEKAGKIKERVVALINELVNAKNQLKKLTEMINEKGASSTYDPTITELKEKRAMLGQKVNIGQEDIDEFNEVENNIDSISSCNKSLQQELEKQKSISSVEIVVPGYFSLSNGLSIDHDFSQDFPVTKDDLDSELSALNNEISLKWKKVIASNCNNLRSLIKKNKDKLNILNERHDFLKTKVIRNKKIEKLTDDISTEIKLQQSAIEREKQRDDIIKHIDQIKEKIIDSQSDYLNIHTDFCERIKSTKISKETSLVFDAKVVWKQTEFMEYLAQVFDNRNFTSFKNENGYDLTDLKPKNYNRDFLSTLWNAFEEPGKHSGLSFKANQTLENILPVIFQNWYNIHYIVKSGNDSIENMSPGKKALVLLEMLINLEDSKCPILIDQPEDDLDNRSIYIDLVQYIRHKKKERQIIIVTHNANVVLGADAEEVIIANQNGIGTENIERRFEYRSGAIENDETLTDNSGTPLNGILNQSGIQTQICDILEGGHSAFKLRQNKYSITKYD